MPDHLCRVPQLALLDHEGGRELQRPVGDDAHENSLASADGRHPLGDVGVAHLDTREQPDPGSDLAHELVRVETPRQLMQDRRQLGDALDEVLPLDDVQVRHRGGTGGGVARVGHPVAENEVGPRCKEGLPYPPAD